MQKISLIQKIGLIFLSFILTFVLLEGLLRLGGFLYLFLQERRNMIGLGKEDAYTILCVGESMTAFGDQFSYPAQLQYILNERSKDKKFNVINKGVPAINTDAILYYIEDHIDRYHPDAVISMIGINDEYYSRDFDKTLKEKKISFLGDFRVVKLARLVNMHFRQKLVDLGFAPAEEDGGNNKKPGIPEAYKEDFQAEVSSPKKIFGAIKKSTETQKKLEKVIKKLTVEGRQRAAGEVIAQLEKAKENERDLLILAGMFFEEREDPAQAEDFYKKACELLPEDDSAFVALGRFYRTQERFDEAMAVFSETLRMSPVSVSGVLEMGKTYDALGQPLMAAKIFKKVLYFVIKDFWMHVDLGDWFEDHDMFDEAEVAFVRAIQEEPRNSLVYRKLGNLYLRQGKDKEAKTAFQKAREIMEDRVNPQTLANYNAICQQVLEEGVKLIVMQYPTRSVAPLKKALQLRDEIIFVENKKNFEEAMEDEDYSDYFYDNFAGDFGHCTLKGNKLIASGLADVLLRIF